MKLTKNNSIRAKSKKDQVRHKVAMNKVWIYNLENTSGIDSGSISTKENSKNSQIFKNHELI